MLPGFKCFYDARSGAHELLRVFQRTGMSPETFAFRPYTRLMQLQHLLRTGQIDEQLYWTDNTASPSVLNGRDADSEADHVAV